MKKYFTAAIFCSFLLAISANANFIPDPKNLNQPANCELHKLYCKTMELQPSVDPTWAMKFADTLLRYSKKYTMDPWLSLAIAMQESSLLNPKPNTKTIVFKRVCDDEHHCRKTHEIITGYSDLSVFQIHVETILYYDLDPVRLSNDLDYAAEWHFKILKQKLTECRSLGLEAWTCYHSNNPPLRNNYAKKVSQYYYGNNTIRQPQTLTKPTESTKKLSSLAEKIKAQLQQLTHQYGN